MGDLLQPWHLLVLMFLSSFYLALFVLPFWFICRKAGFTPWLCALSIIPFGAIVLLFVLAFAEWPSQRTSTQGGYTPPQS